MEALSNLSCRPQQSLHLSLQRRSIIILRQRKHRPAFSNSLFSFSFKTPLSSPPLFSLSIRASNSNPDSLSPNPTCHLGAKAPRSVSPSSPFGFLKLPVCVAVAAAAALLFSRLCPLRPLPATAETVTEERSDNAVSDKAEQKETEEERALEEHVASHPNDVGALKSLMEFKIRSRKLPEVVAIASKLIELEPDEVEWRLLRGHMYCYMGDCDLAKPAFEEILAKDPNRVEAYHGLVMSASQLDADGGKELGEVQKRIQGAIERLKKEKKKEEVREFQLLIAQIQVIEGNYMAALKVYQDLVKEEPKDYRPYLCQGIIYTLLRKKDMAEEQFAKYKRLVPKEHPYASYFDDNVKTTSKVFSEMRQK